MKMAIHILSDVCGIGKKIEFEKLTTTEPEHRGDFPNFSSSRKQKKKIHKTGAINDPHVQIHSPASIDHYFHLKMVLFCEIGNYGTDEMCEISDHYRRVDQKKNNAMFYVRIYEEQVGR